MYKKALAIIVYLLAMSLLLFGCGNYKPPYQRGYDEGYEAGLQAASGGTVSSGEDESETVEKRGLPGLTASAGDDASNDEAGDISTDETGDGDTDDTNVTGQDSSEDGDAVTSEGGDSSDSDVLGEESEPSDTVGSDAVTAPSGRVIRADAVNEAVFSAPEVIEGLRTLYTDEAIFGEYVGDSETNLIHKVGGEHFSSLTYDTIVAFDESMSLQDVLDEGFFTKCECCDR